MHFLHPEFLYLAPLVALPILIHLLNRVRYRRVRWAAIEFLLSSERRAIRRARLRHLVLMALRTAVLAGALLALAQPVFRGGLAALLGGGSQVAVALDASASMSAQGAGGSVFEQGKKLIAQALAAMPSRTRMTAGAFAANFESPFRQAVQDRQAVGAAVESAQRTAGMADVPRALQAAAEQLQTGGGGGTIWLLTDMQAAGWQAAQAGAWQKVRAALEKAGRPRILISDLSARAEVNFSISGVWVQPSVLVEGDSPRLTATVSLHGGKGGSTNVALSLDGKRIDTRAVQFNQAGDSQVIFQLPTLGKGEHAGVLELSGDAVSGDDRFYFLLRTAERIPLLVVDGMPSSVAFEGASDFLTVAVEPPEGAEARSPFSVKTVASEQLPALRLADYAAVFLADVPRLSGQAGEALRQYVAGGGMAMVFPGAHTDVAAWNQSAFPGVRIETLVKAEEGKKARINWIAPTSPVTADLGAEGLDHVLISSLYRFANDPKAAVLATTDTGLPVLLRLQEGKGKVYVFAVSCQADFSNLPFTPVMLLMVHRAVVSHLLEVNPPLSRPAFEELTISLPPGVNSIVTPDGRAMPLTAEEGRPGTALFNQTATAGFYRLVKGAKAEGAEQGAAVAAVNVPVEESAMEKIEPEAARTLLSGFAVSFLEARDGSQRLGAGESGQVAASGFPLAALAVAFLLGEVLLAWSIGRPAPASPAPSGAQGNGVEKLYEDVE